MTRPAAEIRAELDALNARRFARGEEIKALQAELYEWNAESSQLEEEFQTQDALEQQAKLSGG